MRSLSLPFPNPVGGVLPAAGGPRSSVRFLLDVTSAEPTTRASDAHSFEDWHAFRAERQAQRAGRAPASRTDHEPLIDADEVLPKRVVIIALAAAIPLSAIAGAAFHHAVSVML